jgi:hypothetical protein
LASTPCSMWPMATMISARSVPSTGYLTTTAPHRGKGRHQKGAEWQGMDSVESGRGG